MARPRKPTNVLELAGAFKHDPKRLDARKDEPVPHGPIGEPPEFLSELQKECWREFVRLCHDGVLCEADRPFMEYAARVWAQLRDSPEIDPKLGIRFETVCARFGMTPADRSKVSAPKKDAPKNQYSEFSATG